ncbi:MAG: hypothetical protein IPO83_18575 [Chitinophagaceae bacterium]|nr:hypothetical protein [Chitinophagaceae bacterium]
MKKYAIFLMVLFLYSCGKADENADNQLGAGNFIHNTYLIEVPQYYYYYIENDSSSDKIEIFGDTKVFTFLPPACDDGCPPEKFYEDFSQLFEIQWKDPKVKYQAVGVFTHPIAGSFANGNSIGNSEDMVWTWHTGMKQDGKVGTVRFGDGRSVHNGVIDYDSAPELLEFNKLYYLGIWAWDDGGTNLEFTSNEIRMKIVIP